MPRGQRGKGRRARDIAAEKKKERAVRRALKRERKTGAYLKPSAPDFRSFSNQLAAQGLRLHDVPADGNCLFHALAQQLGDRLVTHQTLRRDTVQYMRDHPDQFEPFVAEDDCYDDYLSTLSTEGEYAGNDSIVAFTRAFSAHVIIHQLNSPRWEIMAPPTATPTSLIRPTLHIAYLNGDHYCSVLPITPPPKTKSSLPIDSSLEACTGGVGRGGTAVEGMRGGSSSELQRVMVATGCEDHALAGQVLSDNSHDVALAIVELLQLMDLDQRDFSLEINDGALCGEGQATCPKKKTHHPLPPKRHLSNRERKAQAKMDRKERRKKEQGATTDEISSTFDPVGAMVI